MSEVEASHEYAQLQRRGGRPYSAGHRVMYDAPLALLARNERATKRFWILEVGFGIGYGLDHMIEAGVIDHYVGFEPDKDSFAYVYRRHGSRGAVTLWNDPFDLDVGRTSIKFEHTFCIEVIEHVPPDRHQAFLTDLRDATRGTLWFSTPDVDREPHGVRSAKDWTSRLRAAGFDDVVHFDTQWTDLWCCQ